MPLRVDSYSWGENFLRAQNILMLKQFGRVIWRQSRDISVYNYPSHMLYEIYTNQGYLYVSHDKTKNKVEVLHGLAERSSDDEDRTPTPDKKTAFFFPPLE